MDKPLGSVVQEVAAQVPPGLDVPCLGQDDEVARPRGGHVDDAAPFRGEIHALRVADAETRRLFPVQSVEL